MAGEALGTPYPDSQKRDKIVSLSGNLGKAKDGCLSTYHEMLDNGCGNSTFIDPLIASVKFDSFRLPVEFILAERIFAEKRDRRASCKSTNSYISYTERFFQYNRRKRGAIAECIAFYVL